MNKKVRIFKLAKELNIASSELISFLQEKNYTVRNINTPVDSEMYDVIMDHFKADKTLAEEKTKMRRKRMIQRGEITEASDLAPGKTDDIDKKDKTTEKPAILEAIATLQKKSAEDKEKKKAKAQKEAVEEKAEEEGKPKKKKVTAKAKKKVEEPIEPEFGEAPEKTEISEVDKVAASIETVVPQPVEEPEVLAEQEAVVVEDIDVEDRKVGDTIKTIDLSEIEPRRRRKGKKEKAKKEKAKKEKAKEEKVKEDVVKEAKETPEGTPRKLSKKGKGLIEKTKERHKKVFKEDISSPLDEKPKKKKRKRGRKKKVDEKAVDASIKETLAKMAESSKTKKYRKKVRDEDIEEEEINIIDATEFISVAELARLMEIENSELIIKCLELGMIVSINQRLDMDTIVTVADEFGFEVNQIDEFEEFSIEEEEDDPESLVPRPSIVTIMGHVDHGKTSLLDYMRNSNIVGGEKGGITQHIGAYEVEINEKMITFLDTPGHEAFTAMRARGAQITDIVILIAASDDNVMPQTLEALNHAQAAGVPIIIAINKIDKPNADPEKIKKQFADQKVLVESWGGKYPDVEISAKKGTGIDDLLETILLQAEILELNANPNKNARGVVLEARLEKGKGTVCTILVQSGTLKVGGHFVCGQINGRVRAMFNERLKKIKTAPPSTPVQVLGFTGMPQAGDPFMVLDTDKETKAVSLKRRLMKREQEFRKTSAKTLLDISKQIKSGSVKELILILKADTDGSLEALEDSFMKLANDEVEVKIIHKSVGPINEADVLLASASSAIIMGFHIRPNLAARRAAEREAVDIQIYDIIYDAIADVKAALEGMLEPHLFEEILSTVEVRDIFKIPKAGTIAGCYIVSGKVFRNNKVRLVREGVPVYDGTVSSLKRFKEDAKEVASGFECGIGLENFNDVKVGDILETYKIIEEKRVLK